MSHDGHKRVKQYLVLGGNRLRRRYMFIRRIFYDLSSGDVLRNTMAEGSLLQNYSTEAEAARLGLTNWGAFSWDEYNPEVEAQFAPFDAEGNARTVAVRVDVSHQPHKLIFEYEPSVSE